MATVTLTNQSNSPSGRGASPTVQLNGTDALKLSNIAIGDPVAIGSNSKVGQVERIDLYGSSIRISPLYENVSLDSSSTPEVLAVSEVITITT